MQASAAPKHTNRLSRETSPYLLQHRHNPVDWYAWGPEAFEAARREDKPIFLSIGYSTCYWCHVMERQCFENEAIAALMNERFVNIKVDREERPDLDEVYMAATQLMTRHGGWPMSVWLTHDLKPFYTGTYFPPEPMHGRPSFPQVIESLSKAWREQRDGVRQQADNVAEAVVEHLSSAVTPGPVGVETVQRAANMLLRLYDAEHGGFSGNRGPKFPTPNNLAFLLAVHGSNEDANLWEALHNTLDRMARGGVFDQVGGGFHRYSVDEKWLVPHFEKMLYDNGQLVEVYCTAHAQSREDAEREQYKQVIRETCDYVLREMTDETGAFWSAQDAEVDTREGGNYVWTREEFERVVEDDRLRAVGLRMYGLDQGPNFTDPHHEDAEPVNVLFLAEPLPVLAAQLGTPVRELDALRRQLNARLKEVRDDRKQPGTDDKVLLSWNGMMIAGLAMAGRVLEEPRYVEGAARAMDAVLKHMAVPGEPYGLHRTMRKREAKIAAFLEDYAFLVHALLALHAAQPGAAGDRWLALAKEYTRAAVGRFAHDRGGYYDTLPNQADLFVRTRGTSDGAIPSGNSQMVHNLLDLHERTGDADHLRRAVNDLRSFRDTLATYGPGFAHMQYALLRALSLAGEALAAEGDAAGSVEDTPVTATVEPHTATLSNGDADVTVVLQIAEGYHVNAHDAAGPLVPTRVEFESPEHLTMDVRYPAPVRRRFAFSDGELAVYEGRVEIPLTIRKLAAERIVGPVRLVVHFQACTDEMCLAPQRAVAELQLE